MIRPSPARSSLTRSAVFFGGMVGLFGLEVLLTSTLGPRLSAQFGATGQAVAALVALALGVALLITPAVAQVADGTDGRRLLVGSSALLVISTAAMATAFAAGSVPGLIIAICLFGIGRAASIIIALATVATMPFDAHRLQGVNGAVQRFGAVVAAGIAGVVLAGPHWRLGDAALVLIAALWAVSAWWATRSPVLAGSGGSSADPARSKSRRPGAFRSMVAAYPTALGLLVRDRTVLASGLVNFLTIIAIISTNTFLPLALEASGESLPIGAMIAITLTAREGVAILSGVLFARFGRILGMRAALAVAVAAMALSFVGFAWGAARASLPVLVMAGTAQGISLALCIASTNLLVFLGAHAAVGPRVGITLRLAATQLPPAVAILVITPLLGLAFDLIGVRMFVLCIAVSLSVGIAVLALVSRVLSRPPGPRAEPRDGTRSDPGRPAGSR